MVLFDCLAGDLPGDIFKKMPANSTMVSYGALTHAKASYDSVDLFLSTKHIEPLYLVPWVASIPDEERSYWFKYVADDLAKGGAIFGSKIIRNVKLDQWE